MKGDRKKLIINGADKITLSYYMLFKNKCSLFLSNMIINHHTVSFMSYLTISNLTSPLWQEEWASFYNFGCKKHEVGFDEKLKHPTNHIMIWLFLNLFSTPNINQFKIFKTKKGKEFKHHW